MKQIIKINGKEVVTCRNLNDARNIANALYEAMADIVFTGHTEDKTAEDMLKIFVESGEEFILTIGSRNWEEYIAEEDRIANRINYQEI